MARKRWRCPLERQHRRAPGWCVSGYTLIELIGVLVILGILVAMALPRSRAIIRQAKIARAIGDIRTIQAEIMAFEAVSQPLPADLTVIGRGGTLDPWGRPYVYNPFPPGGLGVPPGARRDRFLVPINSTFDLYSVGEDGATASPLTSANGRDDIVRGNDGGFIGLGSKY